MPIPKYDDLFNPLLEALHKLGGSASLSEQEDEVIRILGLSDAEVAEIHRGNRTKLSYNLAWARYYLKKFGVLENSIRGVWALTSEGQKYQFLDKAAIKKKVKALDCKTKVGISEKDEELIPELAEAVWKSKLLEIIKNIPPDAFERLCQRILRESGFIQVEVTGKSNDGGIDGKGVLRIGGLLSFHVIFQCKRYQGSVSASLMRDFRGAKEGRSDKGLFITTGTFTKEARLEAQRNGAAPIDLIDGEALVEKLHELRIGVKVREKVIQEVEIDEEYFQKV